MHIHCTIRLHFVLTNDITVVHANVANLYYQLIARQYHADEVNVISVRNRLVHIQTSRRNLRMPNTFRMTLRKYYLLSTYWRVAALVHNRE